MNLINADAKVIQKAADLLCEGKLVAIPTETVYGLGADARNPDAIKRIFAAKGRPADHPLIVHIPDASYLSAWAVDIPDSALILAERFWPGPLTLVLKKQTNVPMEITGGQATVALRVPNHPVALVLLKVFGGGIAAPSANRFCRISPTQASHVQEELGDAVDLILDGGECEVGLESTIVDLSEAKPRLLRPGQISRSEIEKVLQQTLELPDDKEEVHAPGRMEVHYSPKTPTFLCSAELIKNVQQGFAFKHVHKLGVLAYSHEIRQDRYTDIMTMPVSADKYAHDLYGKLRDLDNSGVDIILVEQPPQTQEWQAVNDRLNKAAKKLVIPNVDNVEAKASDDLNAILGWLNAVLRLVC
jgi:L-threonylcarbamoyladenylate synthase